MRASSQVLFDRLKDLLIAPAVVGLVLQLVACQPAISPSTSESALAAPFVAPVDSIAYELDRDQLIFDILVYREGALASLGHNHVISANAITAQIALAESFERSAFELRIPVNELIVDDPVARSRYGADFAAPVDAKAISGTRKNMLSASQLNADSWPELVIRSAEIRSVAADQWSVRALVLFRGNAYDLDIPLMLLTREDGLEAAGNFSFRQTELGMAPFAVMLGALQVADQLDVRIRLSARRKE